MTTERTPVRVRGAFRGTGAATGLAWPPWGVALEAGAAGALLGYPWWHELSYWGAGVWIIVALTAVHMAYACRAMVPLPHVLIFISTLQYGIAPMAAYYLPAQSSQYAIADFPYYLSYAVPAVAAIVLGLAASCFGLGPRLTRQAPADRGQCAPHPLPERKPLRGVRAHRGPRLIQTGPIASRALTREMEWLFWGGIAVKLAVGGHDFGGLSFLVVLVADLRFLGLMGLMLLRAPALRWRAFVMVVLEVGAAVGSGMFHEQILWALGFFVLYAYLNRPTVVAFLVWLLLLCVGAFLVHDTKWQIRTGTWGGSGRVEVFGQSIEPSIWNQPLIGGLCLLQSATKAVTGGYSDDSVGEMILRFNQGWIIDRVLHHVPEQEPYAWGETIVSALRAAALPRILAPDKHDVGGREFMARFAGYEPEWGTSMNIGFAGELYANFGYWGGILGCGIYALVLGLAFRWVCVRALQSPLWWAVAVYAAHWAFKVETDIGAVLNYGVKAALVVFVVTRFLPAFRAALGGRADGAAPTVDAACAAAPAYRARRAGTVAC